MNLDRNDGANIRSEFSHVVSGVVAASGTDNVYHLGQEIDRFYGGGVFNSAKIVVAYDVMLTAAKKMSMALDFSDCATSGGSYNTATTLFDGDVEAITAANITKKTWEYDLDLSGYERYIEVGTQVDLNNTSTDKCDYGVVVILTGASVVPCTKAS